MSESEPAPALESTEKPETESPPVKPHSFIPPKKPDKQGLENQCEVILAEINELQEKILNVKAQMDKHANESGGSRVSFISSV